MSTHSTEFGSPVSRVHLRLSPLALQIGLGIVDSRRQAEAIEGHSKDIKLNDVGLGPRRPNLQTTGVVPALHRSPPLTSPR